MSAAIMDHDSDLDFVMNEIERITHSNATDPWIGRVLGGRYRIVQHLADGGMGKVYVAEQSSLGLPFAVKILDDSDPALQGRFEREATATAGLRNPHIVRVFDWGLLPDHGHFLVMELLPGCDLAALMMKDGTLGAKRTLDVLRQLAGALDHAHGHGIVHRDLKPENVMIDEEQGDFVKILDFGVARDLSVDGTYSNLGEVVGTPEYMAPEQAMGLSKVGPAADRYALAVMALEMLTGELPYPSAPPMTTLRMIVDAPPRRPSELGLSLPDLDDVFDRAMARSPADRFDCSKAFVDALEEALSPLLRGVWPETTRDLDPRYRVDSGRSLPIDLVPAVGGGGGIAMVAQVVDDEASMVRVATAVVLTGLGLVSSAFVAGWIAALALS